MKKEARLFQVDQDLKFLILLLFLECIGNSHLVMRTEHCRPSGRIATLQGSVANLF